MKHVRCCSLLLLVLAASCVQKTEIPPAPALALPRLDIAPGTFKEIRAADYPNATYPADMIVTMKERSVVYVFHAQQLRAVISWPTQKQGEVLVPVGRIADTPGKSVFIGVNVEDEAVKGFEKPRPTSPSPVGILCHGCYMPNDECCPNQQN
jgi:hypothetical protein